MPRDLGGEWHFPVTAPAATTEESSPPPRSPQHPQHPQHPQKWLRGPRPAPATAEAGQPTQLAAPVTACAHAALAKTQRRFGDKKPKFTTRTGSRARRGGRRFSTAGAARTATSLVTCQRLPAARATATGVIRGAFSGLAGQSPPED